MKDYMNSNMGHVAKQIYYNLITYWGGESILSNKEIGKIINRNVATTSSAIKELEKLGYVNLEYYKNGIERLIKKKE